MAALTTIAAIAGTAIAAGSYVQQTKAAKVQRQEADNAKVASGFEAQANQQAASAVVARDKAAATVKANEALAASELAVTPEVTVAAEENNLTRKRRVQAQFDITGPATSGAGSIRV